MFTAVNPDPDSLLRPPTRAELAPSIEEMAARQALIASNDLQPVTNKKELKKHMRRFH